MPLVDPGEIMEPSREIERILVVDDESGICTMLVRFLISCGYDCESTTDPVKALSMLEEGEFDLIISDIKMPGMNGLQLLSAISKIDRDIDTIIMTGFTDDYTYSDIIKEGATDFISKPFQTDEIKAKIDRINRERQILRELKESNIAIGVLLRRAELEKDEIRTSIVANIKELVLPYLDKLKNYRSNADYLACIDIAESNLVDICTPLVRNSSLQNANLSPMEVRIANLIRAGKRNKEIASILGVSVNTVMTHCYRLRSKLGLKQQKVNLRAYLNSIDLS
jgi:DNA-binding NarL/FixJ family response regulator